MLYIFVPRDRLGQRNRAVANGVEMKKLTAVKVIDILLGQSLFRASQQAMISRGRHFGGGLSLMLWRREMMEEDAG